MQTKELFAFWKEERRSSAVRDDARKLRFGTKRSLQGKPCPQCRLRAED